MGSNDTMEFHPLAEIFPVMEAAELADLAEDIRLHGLRQPIMLIGMGGAREAILDGKCRYLACRIAKIEPRFVRWNGAGESSPAAYVARMNLRRRHLTPSQRAAAAVEIGRHLEAEAKARRIEAVKRGNEGRWAEEDAGTRRRGDAENSKNPGSVTAKMRELIAKNCSERKSHETSVISGRLCGVSGRYVDQARAISEQSPALFDQVRTGKLNLSQASLRLARRTRLMHVRQCASRWPAGAEGDAGTPGRPDAENRLAAPLAGHGPPSPILHGDCIAEMEKMRSQSIQCIFADPPYNNGWTYDADPTGDRRPEKDYLAWCTAWMAECARLLSGDGSLFVMIDDEHSDSFGQMLRATGLHRRNTIVWWENFPNYTRHNFPAAARYIHYYAKSGSGFVWNWERVLVPSVRNQIGDHRAAAGGRVPDNVWPVSRLPGNARDRVPFDDAPPQVPQTITDRIVAAASDPGARVLDPFAGNGTSGRSALAAGREYIGIERSALYAGQARQWIAAGRAEARPPKAQGDGSLGKA